MLKRCGYCHGLGRVWVKSPYGDTPPTQKICTHCNGKGVK